MNFHKRTENPISFLLVFKVTLRKMSDSEIHFLPND